jgi:hypothetical protein
MVMVYETMVSSAAGSLKVPVHDPSASVMDSEIAEDPPDCWFPDGQLTLRVR